MTGLALCRAYYADSPIAEVVYKDEREYWDKLAAAAMRVMEESEDSKTTNERIPDAT